MRGKNEKMDLSLVLFVLVLAGAALKYIYFSTIGSWEPPLTDVNELLLRIGGFAGVLVMGSFLDMAFSGDRGLKAFVASPTVAGLLLLLVMTSFSVPTWLFLAGALLLSLLNHGKLSLGAAVVLTYFALIATSLFVLSDTPFLTAPYMEASGGDWQDFRRQFHSLTVVAAGMATGPLSFNLLLPILVGSLMLANRKYGPMGWSLLFFFVVGALATLYFGIAEWLLPLFLLNGSVFLVGVFLMPMELKTLKPGTSKVLYSGIMGLSAFMLSYYVNFIWGAYLAFLLLHLLLGIGKILDKFAKND